VTTPPQDHLHLAVFDMHEDTSRRDLERLLQAWSSAAARMTRGLTVSASGALGGDPESPPDDTGEALDLAPSRLSITIGLGPSLFERDGVDRFGINGARPPELERLPSFTGDALEGGASDGDICVQVCADDPLVAFHAVHNLARLAGDQAVIRWSQAGFRQTASTDRAGSTPRNLMGFKDGTDNLRGDDQAAVDENVWIPPGSSPAWFAGGTYLVIRKIEILIEDWDLETLDSQQAVFGRTKGSGAPLSGGNEFTVPDFSVVVDGADAIDPNAHIRLTHPSNHGGLQLLRRSYNFVGGTNPDGRLDAGLLFIAFVRSPASFITVQEALATDKLSEYVRPVGSALFVVPPGATDGGFVGEALLA
jgi:deferrochelatase/peroxidase EfeB